MFILRYDQTMASCSCVLVHAYDSGCFPGAGTGAYPGGGLELE